MCAAVIAVAASNLGDVKPWEWLIFAGALVLANFGEYWLHRIPFHNPRIPDFTYFEHTMRHHAFFSYERMWVEDLNDLKFVLFDLRVVPIMVLGLMPLFFAVRYLGEPDLGWLFLLGAISYYAVYEVVHALSHLSPETTLGSIGIVQRLTHHHRVHHDPRLMRRFNFNFAIPLFDLVFGTTYRAGTMPASRYRNAPETARA